MLKKYLIYVPKKLHFLLSFIAGACFILLKAIIGGTVFLPVFLAVILVLAKICTLIGKKRISGNTAPPADEKVISSVIAGITGFIAGIISGIVLIILLFVLFTGGDDSWLPDQH